MGTKGKPSARVAKHAARLREHALSYPEASEDFPWGHPAYKVRGKAFVFSNADESGFSVTMKLPKSCFAAVNLPFAEATGYGLGKSGWVTAKFAPSEKVPFDLLLDWMDESFEAVAPKRVVKAWRDQND